ncbi:NAD-dependent deacylase [Actinoplanes sp. LDG1-06]|uniref:NAD-dependent protein deacylase n=1 Tax=Paractinoplanes ovalisporus TaxID=2810368 RepID=A0ABS2AP34_9ACTN|nr:NAD-dependent deacylase [Actinoplanes ovalisporus]MBM2621617.1 NAD-dependent deacylase [Actinoplanes ovalisporus]
MESLERAAALIAGAERLVVFTGAGMSAESGVPTFRDALTGLWARYDAQALATPEAFAADPALVWGWYEWRRELARRVRPNAGHEAIARLEHATVITQNVDDLHEQAGSKNVVHLHGSLFAPRCSACAAPAEQGAQGDPPACESCGNPVRPGVVWFGEALPVDALEKAVEAAANADVLITVGTSGVVYPAAEIPQVTARMGGTVIQVDPEPTPLDPICTVTLRGTAAGVLPQIIR